MSQSFHDLPPNLPEPKDDGACDHLSGLDLPAISLPATDGKRVLLSGLKGRTVIFFYPMTGRPGVALPEDWDTIPGARGCTPQVCGVRDRLEDLRKRADRIFGCSGQSPEFQAEARDRLSLNYPLLSDGDLSLAKALNLPTFTAAGRTFVKRLTLICRDRRIEDAIYPVFPSNRSAEQTLARLGPEA